MTVVSTIYNEVLKEFGGMFPTKTSRIIPGILAVHQRIHIGGIALQDGLGNVLDECHEGITLSAEVGLAVYLHHTF